MRFLTCISCLVSTGRTKIVSSTYWIIGNYGLVVEQIGGWMSWCWCDSWKIDCSRYVARTNRRGRERITLSDPLLQWKTFPGIPFKRTAEVPELKIMSTHISHLSKSSSFEKFHNNIVLNHVKQFFEVQLEHHNWIFRLVTLVQIFKSPSKTGLYCSILEETILIRMYQA